MQHLHDRFERQRPLDTCSSTDCTQSGSELQIAVAAQKPLQTVASWRGHRRQDVLWRPVPSIQSGPIQIGGNVRLAPNRPTDATIDSMRSRFVETLQAQLARYKRDELEVSEDGLWVRNGRPYAHILPASASALNLCVPLQAELLALIDKHPNWTRHRDFHHLNSSQAMCWNLLMPALVVPGGLNALSAALSTPAPVKAVDFETILDPVESTNFDSVLELKDGSLTYIEAKLTEREFGSATTNKQRECKRTELYIPRLRDKVPDRLLEEKGFFANYQLLRNLSYLRSPADRLLLLLPRAHTGLVQQAASFRELVLAPWQSQVALVFVEDLIDRLASQLQAAARLHYEECRRKYVLRQ